MEHEVNKTSNADVVPDCWWEEGVAPEGDVLKLSVDLQYNPVLSDWKNDFGAKMNFLLADPFGVKNQNPGTSSSKS